MTQSSEPLDNDQLQQKIIRYYHEHAAARFDYFEQAAVKHCDYSLQFIVPAPARILDVGSGSGRDAAYFAQLGYQVTAIEPAKELRKLAMQKHTHPAIEWVDDRLPELPAFAHISQAYDHIHLSAVIFHLPPEQIRTALEQMHRLLKPEGTMYIGLRIGPSDPERPMFAINADDIVSQSEGLFTMMHNELSDDSLARQDIRWSNMMLKKN